MKTTILQFFQESNGQGSAMRFIYIVGCLYAMVMGAWVFGVTKEYGAAIAIIASISATFTGGKLIQKNMEVKEENNQSNQ